MSSEQSNVLKRHEQITNWYQSETDKASKQIKDAEKIKFTKEVQFLSACNNNDWDEISRLLREGIDINSTQDDGLTSLHQACIDDDTRLVMYLIQHGADIDAQDKEGWTPLFAAISCNYLSITKFLVSHGARLDMVSFDGELPLDQANNDAIASYIKEEMIKQNLDPEEIRNRERNVMLNDVELMKTTKDFSKFTLVDNGGSLLHIAACKDYIDVLEKLLEIISPQLLNHIDNDGWNALHVAAHWGNRKACVMLVNADIDFEKVTFSNQSVLEVSDDDVKPYIREEIRKARFRRQEKASIKRPAEPPNSEYQPSDTKIICQENPSSSLPLPSVTPVEMELPSSNGGDKHVIVTGDFETKSLNDTHKSSLPTSCESIESIKSVDRELKSSIDDIIQSKPDESPHANSNVPISEAGSTLSKEDFSRPVLRRDDLHNINDSKNLKVTAPVLTPSKVTESESQRKDKARHVRSIRRSTQGVTAEDVEMASKMNANHSDKVPETNLAVTDGSQTDSVAFHKDNLDPESKEASRKMESECKLEKNRSTYGDDPPGDVTSQVLELPNLTISTTEDKLAEQVDKKGKPGCHIINKRRTRERPPTGTVDPNDIQAALQMTQPTKLPDVPIKKETEIDYKVLYENELKEIEKLQRNLTRLQRDFEQSENRIKSLQNNHVVPKLQSSTINAPAHDLKEIEKLREDNKKMKEANSALIRVISRLSHPPSKSMTGSN